MGRGCHLAVLVDTVGTITKTSESQPSDPSLFDFSTFRSMAKSGHRMQVDTEVCHAATIAAGQELNSLFAAQCK